MSVFDKIDAVVAKKFANLRRNSFPIAVEDTLHRYGTCTYVDCRFRKINKEDQQQQQQQQDMRGNSLRSNPKPANSMEQDSFESFEDPDDLLVMSTNNLRLSPTRSPEEEEHLTNSNSHDSNELPKSVIVTNVDMGIFDNKDMKTHFESLFREFESNALFHYLRSFRRIRVDFQSHLSASKAKVNMDNTLIGDSIIHCYFIQVLSPCPSEDAHLHVPPLEKQFLISPPCSPPVGWEQPREDRPVVDYDLLAAMAQLTPGEQHELHPTKQINVLGKSVSTPSIVVHIAEDAPNPAIPHIRISPGACGGISGKKIRQTRCPDRQSSLD